jgi:hypothetical protein
MRGSRDPGGDADGPGREQILRPRRPRAGVQQTLRTGCRTLEGMDQMKLNELVVAHRGDCCDVSFRSLRETRLILRATNAVPWQGTVETGFSWSCSG